MSDIAGKLEEMDKTIKDIHHRLFVDNGAPSIQTRLDRNDRAIANLGRVTWSAITGSITIALGIALHKVLNK
jgi:hypothetical protein